MADKTEKQEDQEEKKTYRVKPGQRYAHLYEGDTALLTATEAAPFLGELELVKADSKKGKEGSE